MSLEQFAVTVTPQNEPPAAVVRVDAGYEGTLYGFHASRCDWGLCVGSHFALCFSLTSHELEAIDTWARPSDAAEARFEAILPGESSTMKQKTIVDKDADVTVAIAETPGRFTTRNLVDRGHSLSRPVRSHFAKPIRRRYRGTASSGGGGSDPAECVNKLSRISSPWLQRSGIRPEEIGAKPPER